MDINSDVNVLGSLQDFNLIKILLDQRNSDSANIESQEAFTHIKTKKSFKRWEKAVNDTMISFKNKDIKIIVTDILNNEGISNDSLYVLFLNACINNELLDYLNKKVYFPAYYSGRVAIKPDEVVACLKELKETEPAIKKWTESTITTTASKYLTLLKKFNLMEGNINKTIVHQYIDDKKMILFLYSVLSVETHPNILESRWIDYCFSEKEYFIKTILQKKFMKLFNIHYSGDKLKIENIISYEEIYDTIK